MSFLFVDRITDLKVGQRVQGIKHVTADDRYVMPMGGTEYVFMPSIIGETLGQLGAWCVMLGNDFTLRPVAGVVSAVHIHRPVWVGETLFLDTIIDDVDDKAVSYHAKAYVGDEVVFSIDNAIGPMLPMEQFIASDEVKRQFHSIYRPLDEAQTLELSSAAVEWNHEVTRPCAHATFDRIVERESGQSIIAQKYVSLAAPYFQDHFPRKPVLPLTILLNCKLAMAKQLVDEAMPEANFVASTVRKVKMSDFVSPGDVVTSKLSVKQQSPQGIVVSMRSEVGGKRVCVGEAIFTQGEICDE